MTIDSGFGTLGSPFERRRMCCAQTAAPKGKKAERWSMRLRGYCTNKNITCRCASIVSRMLGGGIWNYFKNATSILDWTKPFITNRLPEQVLSFLQNHIGAKPTTPCKNCCAKHTRAHLTKAKIERRLMIYKRAAQEVLPKSNHNPKKNITTTTTTTD